jgi:hypothetical protein
LQLKRPADIQTADNESMFKIKILSQAPRPLYVFSVKPLNNS